MPRNRTYKGILEVDAARGVIYFHVDDPKIAAKAGSVTLLRINQLPTPIPDHAIDITIGFDVNYAYGQKKTYTRAGLDEIETQKFPRCRRARCRRVRGHVGAHHV